MLVTCSCEVFLGGCLPVGSLIFSWGLHKLGVWTGPQSDVSVGFDGSFSSEAISLVDTLGEFACVLERLADRRVKIVSWGIWLCPPGSASCHLSVCYARCGVSGWVPAYGHPRICPIGSFPFSHSFSQAHCPLILDETYMGLTQIYKIVETL